MAAPQGEPSAGVEDSQDDDKEEGPTFAEVDPSGRFGRVRGEAMVLGSQGASHSLSRLCPTPAPVGLDGASRRVCRLPLSIGSRRRALGPGGNQKPCPGVKPVREVERAV